MLLKEIFSREINRDIKEVIKVDDEASILEEIEEYVPTEHIASELVEVLETYQETINNPSEGINIWVSGFFGSGKSSFAKILGYLLTNSQVQDKTITDRFFELNDIPKAQALLNTIHEQAPSEAVLLDLNTSPNVLQEGEPIVLPIYRTILQEFGYSRDVTLAELEFDLETEGRLEAFEKQYEETFGTPWLAQRDVITAKNRASRVLHELDPETYPSADSWSNAAEPPAITSKWFATRAMDLLRRRRERKARLVMIVDEVGQYVSRSTDRMRHLQGLAEECQKTRGALWLLATSQEKLTDVIDSLEGKQTELAKAQDRFPVRLDLLPSDIDEVTGRRVLEKTAEGAKAVRSALEENRNKLTTSVTLQSDRHGTFSDADFVRLYPLVPYQLQVLIDAVSARRAQGGAPQTMGGSNRTLIRHAQQLLGNPSVGMAELPVGSLVTLDRSYRLLEDVIPTAWRHEIDQVSASHGDQSLEERILMVIALCTDIPGIPLTVPNLAAMLHPSISADPLATDVRKALDHLVAEDRVKEGDEGFKLQSPEQKDWEKTRRNIDMKPGDAARLRKRILDESLSSLTFRKGRTFKIELLVDREKLSDGDIPVEFRENGDLDDLRSTSRGEHGRSRIYWSYTTSDPTWDALAELHRSLEMIERYDNPSQSDVERMLLAEERKRLDRTRKMAEQLLHGDVAAGQVVFDGNTEDAPDGDMRTAVEKAVVDLIGKIYPHLEVFSASFKKNEILEILNADTLDGLPEQCGPDGLGIYRITASGRELVTDSGPIEIVTTYIRGRKQYGEDQTGGQLERHFGGPPYGAPVEAVQAVLAGAIRAGLIEVISQAARITRPNDRRLEQVFGSLPKFRAASYKPAEDHGPDLDVRGEVSEWLSKLTGEPIGLDLQELADIGRATFAPLVQPCTEARSTLVGAGLTVPDEISTMTELLSRVTSFEDTLVVETMHERSADLEAGRHAVNQIFEIVDNEMNTLRNALLAVNDSTGLRDATARAWGEELGDLLQKGEYRQDIARIRSLTSSIQEAVDEAKAEAQDDLAKQVEAALETLRSRYPTVEDDQFHDATQAIRSLTDSEDLEVLRANLSGVPGAVAKTADVLDVLVATKEVRHVRVSEIWAGPITSEEDLDAALSRLREAVLAQLNEDTEVRFR